MEKSVKQFGNLTLVLVVVFGGFVWGRIAGEELHSHANMKRYIARLMASNHGTLLADASTTQEPDSLVPAIDVYETVLDHVQREFVLGIDNNARLSNGALARMFASLNDPRTFFLEPAMRQAQQSALEGRYSGIGANLVVTRVKKDDVEYTYLTVLDVAPGGPADKAGLRTGDRITELNNHWLIAYSPQVDLVRILNAKMDEQKQDAEFKKLTDKFRQGYGISKAIPILESGSGKPVAVVVERPGAPAPIKVTMTTAVTPVDPVDYRVLPGSVGYLRVRQFNSRATDEFQAALNRASGLKGLVVDLRDNPGGVVADAGTATDGYTSALKLIGRLTHGGNVAMIERHPNAKELLTVKPAKQPLTIPVAVLVDGGTANLAELVAAALRDSARARVVGARTFGDPVIQLFTTFKNGAGAEISTSRMFTLAGGDMGAGVQPDVPVAPAADSEAAIRSAVSALGIGA